ncbi:MAG: AAA family ATPase [Tannerellaceae bacterium]|jgi:predicted AAA+ superfamily ATPase|nr:AAA family ATPase [Tannerellaceae bacterium]
METFYRTHNYLLEHTSSPVKRQLMDEINWNDRLIGIKGSRGVGKTTFLLEYAREFFGKDNRECLYINLNHFYFTERTIIDFIEEFRAKGGKVLLIDQVFKYPDWSKELRYCYDHYPDIRIVFSGSSVMRLKEENPDLSGHVASYNLRGFSFREYLNLMAKTAYPVYSLEEIIKDHAIIADSICSHVKPMAFFQDYLHHGYYPFFLEKRNFSENLLKTMNMMLEVDVLYIKQIEQSYLPKLRKLLYLLAISAPGVPNVSQLSKDIATSRATVMNYIKYLTDARLTDMLYMDGERFPKKPAKVYMHNSNLMFPIRPSDVNPQAVRETFFYNMLHKDHHVNMGTKNAHFMIDRTYNFRIEESLRVRNNPDVYYAVDKTETGGENLIPLWLFGFLY